MSRFPKGFQGNPKETKVSKFPSLRELKPETFSRSEHDELTAEYLRKLRDDRRVSPALTYMAEKMFREAITAAPDLLSEAEAVNFLLYNQKRHMKPDDRRRPPSEEQVRKARDTLRGLIESGAVIQTPPPCFLHLKGSDPYGYLNESANES